MQMQLLFLYVLERCPYIAILRQRTSTKKEVQPNQEHE